MSDYIKLDEIDLQFLDEIGPKQFPVTIDVTSKKLKPLEEIIKDEE